jgi:hypothetical protein
MFALYVCEGGDRSDRLQIERFNSKSSDLIYPQTNGGIESDCLTVKNQTQPSNHWNVRSESEREPTSQLYQRGK